LKLNIETNASALSILMGEIKAKEYKKNLFLKDERNLKFEKLGLLLNVLTLCKNFHFIYFF
ncbi:MAG: hypothetical protein RR328_03035, partial [Bacteroidales bacterium]